jgi:methyl-accepting chemotaxis protein
MRITLRSKLIIGGVVAAMLPLVVVGVFSINKSASALVNIAQGQATLTAQNLATMANLYMEQEIEKNRILASEPLIQKMLRNADLITS